ncbi:MAG: xanthine dehydrogenase family protein subunit M [Roseovarius sp.]|uniref:FAD binding domain-containing protein n=1 Tax=Roseobacteraceae TaxID=2854170 RepID=UPI0032EB9C03
MNYQAPTSLDAAVDILAGAKGDCRILAGGTDLLVRMHSDMAEPDTVLDIKRIDSLRAISQEDGGWRIGAAVSAAEMGENADLVADWPGVVEAANLIGSTQIQGRCTIAGNLCNASPAADSVPALVAAEAKARVAGPDGIRDIPVEDVPVSPGKTSLKAGELVASIFLPSRPERSGDAYLRFIPRTEMDIAVVGCGVSLTLDDAGNCIAARVALGAVAPTVIVVPEAAEALVGTPVDEDALTKLAAACSAAAKPIDDKRGTAEYRVHMAGVLARRAAVIAKKRAGGAA